MSITNHINTRLPSALDSLRNRPAVEQPVIVPADTKADEAPELPEPIIGVPNSHHPVDLTDFIHTAAGGPVEGGSAPWATRLGGSVTAREAVDKANDILGAIHGA